MERTIPAVWRKATTEQRQGPAYLVEDGEGWREISWSEAARRVDELAHGLLALGIGRGDRFAILGHTSFEWAALDFALAQIGAVAVPLYPTSSAKDLEYILRHSEAVGVAAQGDELRAKVEGVGLRHLISFAELDDLAARGREHAREHPNAVEELAARTNEDDLLMIVYTSGTTGAPKGCMLLHRNYVSVLQMLDQLPNQHDPDDAYLLFLPLAHTYGQLVLYGSAYIGYSIAFVPDPLRVVQAVGAVRPTAMPSVPRVYEKIYTAVRAEFDAATGAKRRIIDWSLRVGKRASRYRAAQKRLPPALAAQHKLADKLVFSKVKAKLGGRLRYGVSGAAPLSVEILEFFHTLDILILEGYGLTESASGGSVNRMDRFKFGTVGPPLPGVEVKVADDGEIMLRGDNVFAGYYKDDEATRAALTEDGWLLTGDVGELDQDGFLKITDRKKDILITAGGKNVAPQNVENELKSATLISQALVVGDQRPYVAALITLDEVEARKWAEANGLNGDLAVLARDERVRAIGQELVDQVNANHGRVEQIKRFTILPRDFSLEEGEVTPTMKLRRRVCVEHFADEIEQLYAG